jgi:hypothetical protein
MWQIIWDKLRNISIQGGKNEKKMGTWLGTYWEHGREQNPSLEKIFMYWLVLFIFLKSLDAYKIFFKLCLTSLFAKAMVMWTLMPRGILGGLQLVNVFWGWNFAEFWLEIYHFNLYKGFIMKKMIKIHQILKEFFFKLLDFMMSSNM